MDILHLLTNWTKTDDGDKIPALSQHPSTVLERRQELLSHHVRIVALGKSNGLCVYGSKGGLGKTRVILETLKKERIKPLLLNGHITTLSLYTNLHDHPDSVVFLDDCDSLFRNLPALGILRSALWGETKEKRLVTYNSSQLQKPSRFYFTGSIIFAINTLPRQNHAFNAVLSRVDQFELTASNDEVLAMMQQLASRGFDDLSPTECREVVDFIAEFSATRDISLRLLEPSFKKVLYAKEAGVDWKDLVASQLHEIGQTPPQMLVGDKSHDMECLKQVISDFPDDVKEQERAWQTLTQRSRATFYRLKKTLIEALQATVPADEAVGTTG